MKSIILAFSTYTKIPMPHVKWDERSMRYMIAAFPLTGIAVGFIQVLCGLGLPFVFHFSKIATAGLLTILPLVISGGIHMDGFMDTSDALGSYQDIEKRLDIMKDPHIGGFAVIRMVVYLIAYTCFSYELLNSEESMDAMFAVWAVSFIFSRTLGAVGVTHIQKAKADGMVSDISKDCSDLCRYIIYGELLLSALVMARLSTYFGLIAITAGGVTYLYYKAMSVKKFGGVTGDLSGWFLQVCELVMLMSLVFADKIMTIYL